jgi:hypothetical protein
MKNNIGKRSVLAMVSADQNPLVATDPSPPRATAMAPFHSGSASTSRR